MDILSPNELHRTTKLELDEGRARTLDEAHEIVAGYVLQIDVGVGVSKSETRQAMLVTAVNAASRAFLGGVRVRLHDNGPMSLGWVEGMDMATAVETYGGEIAESLDCEHPTLVIGDLEEQPLGSLVLHATWEGWSGGVVEETKDRLAESLEFPLAGMLAAALGVSEAFQNVRGDAVAGRRSIGLSLSVMVVVAPAFTPAGMGVRKVRATLSPSSSMSSAAAVKVKEFSVSPLRNTRFAGTPE